jgi:hypothetical protein
MRCASEIWEYVLTYWDSSTRISWLTQTSSIAPKLSWRNGIRFCETIPTLYLFGPSMWISAKPASLVSPSSSVCKCLKSAWVDYETLFEGWRTTKLEIHMQVSNFAITRLVCDWALDIDINPVTEREDAESIMIYIFLRCCLFLIQSGLCILGELFRPHGW